MALRMIWYQFIALSLVLNVFLFRQHYVVRCSAGGMFMTQLKCDELANNKVDAEELGRQEFLSTNQDILQ